MKSIVIGRGDWGNLLMKYIQQDSNFEIIDVFGKDFSFAKIPQGAQVAFVVTPLTSHFNIAYECLRAGLNVFVEKPTCESVEEFNILKDVAQSSGVRFYTDYIYLTSPSILKIQEILCQLNGILSVKASIKQYGKFYEGESALDVLGVHFLSVFCFLFGTPSLAESHNTNPNANRFVFDINGIATELECSLISEIKERKLEIVAKGGKILFDMLSNKTLRVSIGDKQEIFSFDEKNNITNSLRKFYAILNDEAKYLEHCNLSYEVAKTMDMCKQ